MHVLSSDPAPFGSTDALETREETRSGAVDGRSPTPVNDTSSQDLSQLSLDGVASVAESPKQERRNSDSGIPSPSSLNGETGNEFQSLSQSLPSSIGYLANRWNTGISFSTPSTLNQPGDESFRYVLRSLYMALPTNKTPRLESFPSSANSTAHSSPVSVLPLPSAASSQFRLSLSLEGKAEIVSAQQSPPRPAQPPLSMEATTLPPVHAPRALHRSRSALPGITLPPISALTANLPPRLTRGRSRNVHAWESCCEADTRDELTTLAENESSGSAVAAISLLRSSSQTASLSNLVHGHTSTAIALQSNSTKRNAPPSRRDSTKKPRLARASSSVARMQSLPPVHVSALEKPELVTEIVDPEKKTNKASLSVILSPAGGDSDKENWSPDEEGNPIARRRPLPSVAPTKSQSQRDGNPRRLGRVLGEQGTTKRQLLGSRANTAPVPRLRGGKAIDTVVSIFEDGECDANDGEGPAKGGKQGDDEVERFLRGEVSPSKKGDVDCVAGLLALSQGNWR
jgi:hypothetical protein